MRGSSVKGTILTQECGRVVRLSHRDAPLDYSKALSAKDPAFTAAQAYLKAVASVYQFSESDLSTLSAGVPGKYAPNEPERLYRGAAVGSGNARTVVFDRAIYGLPVVGEGVAVLVRLRKGKGKGKLEILASARGAGSRLDVAPVRGEAVERAHDAAHAFVIEALGEAYKEIAGKQKPKVASARICVVAVSAHRGGEPERFPWSMLPEVVTPIAGANYVVALEVHLTAKGAPFYGGSIRVVVDVETRSVRVLHMPDSGATVTATTWGWDPVTRGTGTTLTPSSTVAQLDAQRETFAITTTTAATLVTSRAVATEIDVGSPIPVPTGAVQNPSITSNDGAMLAGFAQLDNALAQIEDLGWTLAGYLSGQLAIPIPVDGRSSGELGATISFGNAVTSFRFGQLGTQLWGGVDRRIVYHEVFGHAVLVNRIGSTNLPFVHSFGDAIAAIYGDVDNPNRSEFQTFPFTRPCTAAEFDSCPDSLARRHDRVPSAGSAWGWGTGSTPSGGSHDAYREEQKLSSTLFRLYRSLGGDDASATVRRLAARTAAWLTLQTAYRMTPLTVPTTPLLFEDAMEDADADDWSAMGWFGGAYHKVVRWAFEKQGLFTDPVSTEAVGKPPSIDVYIPDSRVGEYPYTTAWSNNPSIWNRHAADAGTTNQAPVAGVTNYIYVKVANRGTSVATGAKVRVYAGKTSVNPKFPIDFTKIGHVVGSTTYSRTLIAGSLPASSAGTVVVGPFEWIPKSVFVRPILAVVDHKEDRVNTLSFTTAEPVEVVRLVPNDNNTAMRSFVMFSALFKIPLPPLAATIFRLRGPRLAAPIELEHRLLDKSGKVLTVVKESVNLGPNKLLSHPVNGATVATFVSKDAANVLTVARTNGIVVGEFLWLG